MMEEKKYPQAIAGRYKVSFSNLTLKPLQLRYVKPNEHVLVQIAFENGEGVMVWDNGYVSKLLVKFEESRNQYKFTYNYLPYVMKFEANLGGLVYTVDLKFDDGLDGVPEFDLMSF
jgi:hypothetical protein